MKSEFLRLGRQISDPGDGRRLAAAVLYQSRMNRELGFWSLIMDYSEAEGEAPMLCDSNANLADVGVAYDVPNSMPTIDEAHVRTDGLAKMRIKSCKDNFKFGSALLIVGLTIMATTLLTRASFDIFLFGLGVLCPCGVGLIVLGLQQRNKK